MKVLSKPVSRYSKHPLSVRSAMRVIVIATFATVVVGGLAMWMAERSTFTTVGLGFWWALQTVTTVGYGDIIPTSLLGRVVAGFVMLESIAFLAVVTAALTSNFVERARSERLLASGSPGSDGDMGPVLADIVSRLERIEAALPSVPVAEGDPDLSAG